MTESQGRVARFDAIHGPRIHGHATLVDAGDAAKPSAPADGSDQCFRPVEENSKSYCRLAADLLHCPPRRRADRRRAARGFRKPTLQPVVLTHER